MGDIVRHLLQSAHQFGDAVEHGVDVADKPVEFIPRSGHRQPPGEVAVGDAPRLVADPVDAGEDAAGDDETADGADQGDDGERVQQRVPQDRRQAVSLGEVVADQQPEAARQGEDARQSAAALSLDSVTRLDHAGAIEGARRQRGHVADQRLAGMCGDEVQAGAGLLDPPIDDLNEAGDAALRILFREAGNVGIHALRDLILDRRIEVGTDAVEDEAGADRRDEEVGERDLEDGGAEELAEDGQHRAASAPTLALSRMV